MRNIVNELTQVYLGVRNIESLDVTLDKAKAYYSLYSACLEYSNACRSLGDNLAGDQIRILDEVNSYLDVANKLNFFRANQ